MFVRLISDHIKVTFVLVIYAKLFLANESVLNNYQYIKIALENVVDSKMAHGK